MSELERRLLARLTDKNEFAVAWELGLRTEAFVEPVCSAIYEFMVAYWQHEHQKMTPNLSVIATNFPGVELPNDQEISTTWATEQLKNSYSALQLQVDMMEASKLSTTDPQGAVKFLRAKMHETAETITPRHSRSNMVLNVDERRQRYLDRREGDMQGVTLGLPELDAWTNGLLPGELAVLGAYSKTGKTWLLAKIIVAARRAGLIPIIFTLEMPKEEIEDRIDAMYSGISYDRLSHSKLTIDEMKVLREAQEALRATGDVLIEQPEEGDRTVGTLVNRARHAGANYMFVDQLSFMEPGRKVRDLKEHHSVVMKQFKTEIGRGSVGRLPCVLAVQFNRDSVHRREGIGLDSFANATEVEATCDLALGLWRNEELAKQNSMKIQIMGARRSRNATWMLKWHLVSHTEISVDRKVDE